MPRGSDIYKSPWLKAADLYDGEDDEATYTIARTDLHEFEDSRTRESKQQIVLEFRETEKKLGLNATNFRMLAAIFASDESDDWIGRQVVLFVAQDRMPDGSTGDCIRVKKRATEKLRDQAAKPSKKAATAPAAPSRQPQPMTQAEVDDDEDIEVPF